MRKKYDLEIESFGIVKHRFLLSFPLFSDVVWNKDPGQRIRVPRPKTSISTTQDVEHETPGLIAWLSNTYFDMLLRRGNGSDRRQLPVVCTYDYHTGKCKSET